MRSLEICTRYYLSIGLYLIFIKKVFWSGREFGSELFVECSMGIINDISEISIIETLIRSSSFVARLMILMERLF